MGIAMIRFRSGGLFSFADRTRIIASAGPDILRHAQTNQLFSHLIKALGDYILARLLLHSRIEQ
jgi:hypothetical protein